MPNLTLPITEQKAIVEFVTSETFILTSAIDRYEREITLLREYRTRLVADVVTGKLDVREAALLLPEEDVVLAPEDVVDEAEEPELEEAEG
jgi:type I restriction enzyme S subunit